MHAHEVHAHEAHAHQILLSRTYVFAAFGGRWPDVAFLILALNRQLGTLSLRPPLTERFDPIAWWSLPDVRESFPTLHRWALDIFACPATSCECERAFSSAKKLITSERNLLGDDLIEALECLRAWWNNGLIQRP